MRSRASGSVTRQNKVVESGIRRMQFGNSCSKAAFLEITLAVHLLRLQLMGPAMEDVMNAFS